MNSKNMLGCTWSGPLKLTGVLTGVAIVVTLVLCVAVFPCVHLSDGSTPSRAIQCTGSTVGSYTDAYLLRQGSDWRTSGRSLSSSPLESMISPISWIHSYRSLQDVFSLQNPAYMTPQSWVGFGYHNRTIKRDRPAPSEEPTSHLFHRGNAGVMSSTHDGLHLTLLLLVSPPQYVAQQCPSCVKRQAFG